nr:MAG TPA: hypothetical protein [Caudoviricetes sp.]
MTRANETLRRILLVQSICVKYSTIVIIEGP